MENLETTQQAPRPVAPKAKASSLWDKTGRLIPFPESRVFSQVSRGYFTLVQPRVDFGEIHARTHKHLGISNLISKEEFEKRCLQIHDKLKRNEQTRGLLSAVAIPFFCTPQTASMDMGKELDTVYLKAVKSSYEEKFPEYTCSNYFAGKLEGDLSVVPGVRYERFIEARKKGVVVGWYFPNCLAEYMVPDQRALISKLPEDLILSGAIDAAAAFIGTPEIIFKKDDGLYPHLLCMSSIKPKNETTFYHFEAYGWNLEFNCRSYLGAVSEYWAGGLIAIG